MTRFCVLTLALFSAFVLPKSAEASELNWDPSESAWVGPHWNMHFGAEHTEYSIGLEASYWRPLDPNGRGIREVLAVGADVGIEYNWTKDKWVSYGEFQAGFGLVGASIGLVIDPDFGSGVQVSTWANYIVGAMYRYRSFSDPSTHRESSFGIFGKAPFYSAD